MEMPSILEVLREFPRFPPGFIIDPQIYKETWEWALTIEGAEPVPYFSCDATPILCWAAVIESDDEDESPTVVLPSGIVVC